MKTKETSNYLGCKTPDDESTREQAITWWDSLSDISIQMPSKSHLCKVYHGDMRIHKSLTGREIEEIWKNEVQVKELSNAYHNVEYLKPNQKQSPADEIIELVGEDNFKQIIKESDKRVNQKQLPKELEGVVPKIITIEEKIKTVKDNAKEFKQFDESLFRAYIDKFSTRDLSIAFDVFITRLLKDGFIKDNLIEAIKNK